MYPTLIAVCALAAVCLLCVSWATTNTGFVQSTKAGLRGTAAAPINTVIGLVGACADEIVQGVAGVRLDKLVDLSTAGYAKNGAFSLALAISTPVSVDVTTISSTATSSTGDNSFTTIYSIEFFNSGAQDVIVGAGTTPFLAGMTGTAPKTTVPAGGRLLWQNPAGWSPVFATNAILKFDPSTIAATIGVAIGGA